MKKTFFFLSVLALLFTTGCQKSYDDVIDELKKKQQSQTSEIDNLRKELQSIYVMVNSGNQDIATLKGLVDALQKQKSVVSYKAVNDGYELSMSDGTVITLKNGAKGADGHSPAVNVKKDGDNYFWTIDGKWLTDAAGKKIPATGEDGSQGNPGITPQLRVNAANQWEVSVNNGSTWNIVRDTSGNPVLATGPSGAKGADGHSPAVNVKKDGDNYFWTIDGKWLTDAAGKKIPATGEDGSQGNPGITPQLRVNAANQWEVSVNNGSTWNIVRDTSGNPVLATGPKGNDGDANLVISETDDTITVVYKDSTYVLPKKDSYSMTFTTSKKIGEIVWFQIDAAPSDRNDIWVDLNNNGIKDPGESIVKFNTSIEFIIGSQTITLYGKITKLDCYNNGFTTLDLSNNFALEEIDCSENFDLSSLNVSKNINLRVLECFDAILTELDVSNCHELEHLDCDYNKMKELDVSNNKKLKILLCNEVPLTHLDLSNNKELISLDFSSTNTLKTINIANGNNRYFTYFNVTKNPNLTCIQVDRDFNPDPAIWKKDDTATWNNSGNPCP